jgi:hypothetical protein
MKRERERPSGAGGEGSICIDSKWWGTHGLFIFLKAKLAYNCKVHLVSLF